MTKQYVPEIPRVPQLILLTVHVWNAWNVAHNGASHAEILTFVVGRKTTAEWLDRNSVTRMVEFTYAQLHEWYDRAYNQYRRKHQKASWQECIIGTMPEMTDLNSQLAA